MLELKEALARILAAVAPAKPERIPIAEAGGRLLAETVRATVDLPPFDNSSMDGYALRAADVSEATRACPARLRLAGRVAAGETFPGELSGGQCVRLFTGSSMPRGADAVVMQEDTLKDGADAQEIQVLEPVRRGENVRFRGEDVAAGAVVGEAGQVITAGRLSLLAAAGSAEVIVGSRPTVGVLATGSELREPGQALGPGQIHESNRLVLVALIQSAGAVPRVFPLVPDVLGATRTALVEAFESCDMLVTSGGVSVGEIDFVKAAFDQVGGELQYWKVAIKPGRPCVFGRRGQKFLFGLPGNPVSAVVTFLLLVRPALRRWQGAAEVGLPVAPGILAEPLANEGERTHFLRVQIDNTGCVRSAGKQASHVLSSLAGANALLEMPPHAVFEAGRNVTVIRWD